MNFYSNCINSQCHFSCFCSVLLIFSQTLKRLPFKIKPQYRCEFSHIKQILKRPLIKADDWENIHCNYSQVFVQLTWIEILLNSNQNYIKYKPLVDVAGVATKWDKMSLSLGHGVGGQGEGAGVNVFNYPKQDERACPCSAGIIFSNYTERAA